MPPLNTVQQLLLSQLNTIGEDYKQAKSKAPDNDTAHLSPEEVYDLMSRARAIIEKAGGISSPYQRQAQDILKSSMFEENKLPRIMGVVQALQTDVAAGYLLSFEELIHGAMFADYLEMADHLFSEGYKDPAAVVAGSTLEIHLKQLCPKYSITIDATTPTGTRPKKADTLNAELAGAGAYSKLDQKSVTVWLDLRNKAAHGDYGAYLDAQVALLITGIRDFITRNPA